MLNDVADKAAVKNCTATRRVIDTYKEISDSLYGLVNNARKQKERYHINARSYVKGIAEAEKEIIENCELIIAYGWYTDI